MANSNPTGIYSVDDLLAVRNASAAEFGAEKVFDTLKNDLSFYNGLISEQMSFMAENVDEQSRVYGGSVLHEMTQVDEYGVAPSKKGYITSDVSFPLRLFSSSIGWTQKYLEVASPAELMSEYLSVRGGHSYEVTRQIKNAIYNKDNYTFVDRLTNSVSLTIRRFVNADGQAIPDFNGKSFDGASHTHYKAKAGASLANADIDGLVSNVTEHGHTRGLMLVVSLANKAAITALTGFTPLSSKVMVYNATDSTVVKLDTTDLDNQHIGYWGDIPVWVKPYAVENYVLCITTEGEKALGFRQRKQDSLKGLRLVSEIPSFPLISKSFEAEFGVAVNSRTSGAVLYIGGTTWANATIA